MLLYICDGGGLPLGNGVQPLECCERVLIMIEGGVCRLTSDEWCSLAMWQNMRRDFAEEREVSL